MIKGKTLLAFSALLASVSSLAAEKTYDWTGAYAGVNLGSIWTDSDLTASHINLLPDSGTYSQSVTSTAVNPGLQMGYLYQFDEHWVIGGEGDFTYPATSAHFTQVNTTGSDYDQFSVKYNVQGSLRLRAGYALDRFLPYFTTGVSFADMGLTYSNGGGDYYRKTTTQTGWVVGTGVEYGFLDNPSGRVEYMYTNYGNALNMGIPTIEGQTDSSGTANATMNTNVLRAAVNYRF